MTRRVYDPKGRPMKRSAQPTFMAIFMKIAAQKREAHRNRRGYRYRKVQEIPWEDKG